MVVREKVAWVHVTGVASTEVVRKSKAGKGSCHGRFLSGTTPRVNSTRNAHFHGGDSLPFSILSLLTMANWSRIPNALSHPRTWLKSILSMDLLHLSLCRDDHH